MAVLFALVLLVQLLPVSSMLADDPKDPPKDGSSIEPITAEYVPGELVIGFKPGTGAAPPR